MSLKNKLNRLKPHMKHSSNQVEGLSEKKMVTAEIHNIPFLEDWQKRGVTPFFVDENYCLVREVRYPLTTMHGKYSLGAFLVAVQAWQQSNVSHPLSTRGYNPRDLFFFDTETTGLGGGVGNTIFLLGHARFSDDEIIVTQHLLPKPGNEVPLYTSFLQSVDYSTLVTYNGKAFDWPQVKTRHTLVRDQVPKLPSFGHFDLFHAARRLWKHKLERMKLAIVETEILGVSRENDVPGFLAPMIYFDFVEHQDPERIFGVLLHNEVDILSLITLYTHISFQLLGIDDARSLKEQLEVGRWYSYVGDHHASEAVFREVAASDEKESYEAKWHLSLQLKKQKKLQDCIPLWLEIMNADESKWVIGASVELAKWYEHKQKDFEKALEFSIHALQLSRALDLPDTDHLKRILRLNNRNKIVKE